MRLTREMVVFDGNLPMGVKVAGYALGFALTIAARVAMYGVGVRFTHGSLQVKFAAEKQFA